MCLNISHLLKYDFNLIMDLYLSVIMINLS